MKMKKIISLLLASVMIFSGFSVSSLAVQKYNYVVLGDSIAFGSGLVNGFDACYGKLVADTCGFDYVNHSVPGATTSGLIGRLSEKLVRDAVARADIISISIGGNDFLDGVLSGLMYDAIVESNYTEFDRIGERIYTNIKRASEIIFDINDDAVILLQTLYNPQSGYVEEAYQQGVDRVNEAIYRYANENPDNVAVVDVAFALDGDPRNFADDTMHPSARGNELIAHMVLLTLRRLGFTNKTRLSLNFPGVDVILGPAAEQMLNYYAFSLHTIDKSLDAVYTVV